MKTMATWAGFKFVVSSVLVRGFENLKIQHSCETETATSGGEQYVTRKNAKPASVSLTAVLNAATGCDVKSEAQAFIEAARSGETDYLYVAGKKPVNCRLMLTDASASEIVLSSTGQWVSAKVESKMAQASMIGGGMAGGGSGKATVKSKTAVTTSNPASRVIEAFHKVAGTSTEGTARTSSIFLANPTAQTKTALSTATSKAMGKVDVMIKSAKATTAAKKATTASPLSKAKTQIKTITNKIK
ncbi:MAG: hypothetical protein LLF96_07460 [Eubacteriales bacterium]|nr:hypothetical protein [Eubacteriales bacterium]